MFWDWIFKISQVEYVFVISRYSTVLLGVLHGRSVISQSYFRYQPKFKLNLTISTRQYTVSRTSKLLTEKIILLACTLNS
jgi:hypothetical protein